MSFLHPEFLYYMLPPMFILFGLLLTQKESEAHFFSEEVMSKLRVSANTLTLRARNALFLLMGFFMVVALAQPVINDGTIQVKAKSADIMIALDISDSMLAQDIYPNRLESAKQKALTLLDSSPNERVGVVAFAKNSYLVSPLSFDTSAVSFLLRQLDTTSITEKGTDFLSILEVLSKTSDSKDKKYLLILSDGGDKKDFSKEIEKAKEKNIVVFVLGIATKKGAPIKLENGSFIKHHGDIIISKLNENIANLATKTGGVYIQSTTSDSDIKAMLSEILNISEEKELKSEEINRYIPLFYYPLGLALFILLIATSSMSKRERLEMPSAFLLFGLLFVSPEAKAGLLDFLELKDAKESYKKQDYERSAKLYQKHAELSGNAESYYNSANALYKQKKYDEAVKSYEKALFDTEDLRAKNFSNMGNAYAKQGKPETLQKAVETYEKSLEIKEDTETRENLEAVKKLLEQQKQESKDKDKKNGDKKKDDKQESKDSETSDENQDKSSDEKDDSKEQGESSKSDKSKDKSKSSDDMKSKEEKEEQSQESKDKESENQEKKDDLKELKSDDNNNSKSSSDSSNELNKDEMSDAEETKWIKQLNQQKSTYMYKLNKQKPKKENLDEKPW